NFQNVREACETNSEALKKIAEMWKTSSENPKMDQDLKYINT
ncbi:3200_t:CDS:1, partial [Racocetra persica]